MDIKEIMEQEVGDIMKSLMIKKPGKEESIIDGYIKEYDVRKHQIFDKVERPDKLIKIDNPDGEGQVTERVKVARIGFAFQKLIVKRAAAFLLGEGVKLIATTDEETEKTAFDMLERVWQNTKLDYRTREIARILFSETEVAELWYTKENGEVWEDIEGLIRKPNQQLKVKILANSKGDRLFPHFDQYGDMDAFARRYDRMDNNKTISYFDVYTADYKYYYRKDDKWVMVEKVANPFKKIPIIYYTQEKPDWDDVQVLIERYETLVSNFADTNDYFASPLYVVKGEILGFAKKGEQGKVMELEPEASLDVVGWDQAPEAVKLERDTLNEAIYTITQTPDISFTKMQGIGNLASASLELMFLDAKLKSLMHQEIFGECMQRRINLINGIMATIAPAMGKALKTLYVQPEFEFYMPKNIKEIVETLTSAVGGKPIMSRKSATKYNPYVDNVDKELEEMDEDMDFGLRTEGFFPDI